MSLICISILMAFSLVPYLNFDGCADVAMNLYKSILGGEFTTFQRFNETEMGQGLNGDEANRMMHVALEIKPGYTIMASDILPSMGHVWKPGNNHFISLNADSETQATQWFEGLSIGGEIEMPLQRVPWGALFAIFTDKYGVKWMINCDNV
jgi:PhnB protein